MHGRGGIRADLPAAAHDVAANHSILFVEDDAAIRDVYAELLRSEGYVVSLAANGEEAMRLLTDGDRPCLIVIDLLMPVLDGWGLAARLGDNQELAAIPFIVVSAQPPSDGQRTPPAARTRLTKPVALQALLDAIELYCPATD